MQHAMSCPDNARLVIFLKNADLPVCICHVHHRGVQHTMPGFDTKLWIATLQLAVCAWLLRHQCCLQGSGIHLMMLMQHAAA